MLHPWGHRDGHDLEIEQQQKTRQNVYMDNNFTYSQIKYTI